MKVKVLTKFRDRTADLKLRKPGEIIEVTKDRAEKLKGLELVTDYQEPKKATSKMAAEQAVIFMPEGLKLRGDTVLSTVCETHIKLSVQTAQGKTV